MTTYERVKSAIAGPVSDAYLELKMLCLFYFALERDKNDHNVETAMVREKQSIFPLFILVCQLIL